MLENLRRAIIEYYSEGVVSLAEMAFVAGTFGEGPMMAYAMVALKDVIDAFIPDHEK